MATTAPFTVQPRLTQIALAVRENLFIADEVCPRVPVEGEKFVYTKLTTEESFTIPDTKIGRTSQANEVEFGATDVTDSTEDHGLEDPVPNKDIKNAQGTNVDPLGMATELTTQLVLLAREQRVATLLFTLANYAASLRTTLAGNSQWSDWTNSNPVDAMLAAMDSMLIRPNTIVMGRAVWTKVRQHPKVTAAVLGQSGVGAAQQASGSVSRQAVADLLEVDRILIGESFYNTAKKGQTASYSRLWGKHCALLHINRSIRSPRTTMPTFCFTAEWGARRAGTYEDPKRGIDGSTVVKVVEQVKELIPFQEAGYFFQNAVA